MTKSFVNYHSAICGTGYQRLIQYFYSEQNAADTNGLINMQVRYWIEAVEKFYQLEKDEFNENLIEEGVFIINCLANSLLVLGGANWAGSGDFVPPLKTLYDGQPFNLKNDRPDLFEKLLSLNNTYNNLSKHFCQKRSDIYKTITYDYISSMMESVSNIWQYVCGCQKNLDNFHSLFSLPPWHIIQRGYYPKSHEE